MRYPRIDCLSVLINKKVTMSLASGKELASLNLSRGDSTDNLLGMTDDRDVLLTPSATDSDTALIEPDPPPVASSTSSLSQADDLLQGAAAVVVATGGDQSDAVRPRKAKDDANDDKEADETDEPQPLAESGSGSAQSSSASQRRKVHAANKQQSIASAQSSRPLLAAPSFDQRPAPNLAESPWSSTETSYQRSRKNSVNLLDCFSGSGKSNRFLMKSEKTRKSAITFLWNKLMRQLEVKVKLIINELILMTSCDAMTYLQEAC